MKVLITGDNGFMGQNLCLFLSKKNDIELLRYNRSTSDKELDSLLEQAEFICHLAGVNRPKIETDFWAGNEGLTGLLVSKLKSLQKKTPILYSSSIQSNLNNPYGLSKKSAETILSDYHSETGACVYIYQLPNVFGKFSRPNYNSAIATFSYNIQRNLPIEIHDPSRVLQLNYIDDVISSFYDAITQRPAGLYQKVEPLYSITVGELANVLHNFNKTRKELRIDDVGVGLTRALYSTFISFMPIDECNYEIPQYGDSRGRFVEMLKTETSGQFSFFTAPPGATRGRHYHHTKTEKFLIVKGTAKFRFQHTISDDYHEVIVSGDKPTIVDTIPGWTHDISNIGDEELIVMLWANEVFDLNKPDTFAADITK